MQTSLTDFLVYSPPEAQMTFSQGMLFGLDVHFILMLPRGSIHLASQACLPANRQLVQQHPYKAAGLWTGLQDGQHPLGVLVAATSFLCTIP